MIMSDTRDRQNGKWNMSKNLIVPINPMEQEARKQRATKEEQEFAQKLNAAPLAIIDKRPYSIVISTTVCTGSLVSGVRIPPAFNRLGEGFAASALKSPSRSRSETNTPKEVTALSSRVATSSPSNKYPASEAADTVFVSLAK